MHTQYCIHEVYQVRKEYVNDLEFIGSVEIQLDYCSLQMFTMISFNLLLLKIPRYDIVIDTQLHLMIIHLFELNFVLIIVCRGFSLSLSQRHYGIIPGNESCFEIRFRVNVVFQFHHTFNFLQSLLTLIAQRTLFVIIP